MKAICQQCACTFEAVTGRANRAMKIGAPLFCSRACFGLSHRSKNTPKDAERRAAKAAYDREYRKSNLSEIKRKKKEYFKRTYDPAQAAIIRKQNMHRHIEYCRHPEYKAWKIEYDRQYRAKKTFGEFADAFLLLRNVENEIEQRASRYEIGLTNGTINKAQTRRRAL